MIRVYANPEPEKIELDLEAVSCPFCGCGGDLVVLVRHVRQHSARNRDFVKCRACLARGPEAAWSKKAIELWNQSARKDQ